MLKVSFSLGEGFNSKTSEFIPGREVTLVLEHSLVSLAKWESKWCKPFLGGEENRKQEESLDYIRCMTITQNVDPDIYEQIPSDIFAKINAYIDSPQSGTIIHDITPGNKGRGEMVTSELIYYWMVAFNIPFECQKWHLNRLITLIRICNIKQSGEKKMSRKETMSRNKALNEARKAKYNTKG